MVCEPVGEKGTDKQVNKKSVRQLKRKSHIKRGDFKKLMETELK